MAFSTQKRFQYVPFLNESPHPVCPPMDGIKLKTYASARDERAWSMSDKKHSQYLIDLVSCRLYDDDNAGDGLQENSTNRSQPCKKPNLPSDKKDKKEKLAKEEAMKAEKDNLLFRLNESQEKLKNLRQENEALTAVLSEEHTPELFQDIKKKISQLRKSSKIDKNDENELLKMLNGLGKADKAFSAINIQNAYLRKSVEKLSLRADILVDPETSTDVRYLQNEVNNLRREVAQLKSFEEETLQKEANSREDQSMNQQVDKDSENVDKLKVERNALREKCESFASVEGKIIEWKNDAEQFKSFRKKACMALRQKDEEIQDLRERNEEVEYEFKEMIKCFKTKEQERETVCSAYDCLKEENQLLKEEICRCNCDLKGIPSLQNQIQLLSKELCEKNCAIEQYDIQFQQLLGVIEGLQSKAAVDIRSLQDEDSQTHSENIEELAVSTRATLEQISKELEYRQELEADLAQSMADLEAVRRESEEKEKVTIAMLDAKEIENQKLKESLQKTSATVKESLEKFNLEVKADEDCSTEILRLKEFITQIKSEHENEIKLLKDKSIDLLRDLESEKLKRTEVEKLNDQANKLQIELDSAKDENQQLKNQNQELNKALEESKKKVEAQKDEIKKLDQKTTELLCSSEANLKEVGKLVNDISNVQDRNENLKSVLGAVDYSEKYKQEIEDLKKLLDEETKKTYNFGEQNKVLQKDLEQIKETLKNCNDKNEVLQGDLDKTKKALETQKTLQQSFEQNQALKRGSFQSTQTPSTSPKTPKSPKVTNDKTFRTVVKASDAQETDLKRKSVSRAPDASAQPGSSREKKGSTKLSQLQKLHEATRNAERNFYEKEIEGHRKSNELLKNSLTKLTSKVQNSSAADFEKEMRSVLDNFAMEICKWRCEKNFTKLTKLQEICKRILEYGINCLSYKELVYLHQRMSEAALRLKPSYLSSSSSNSPNEFMCCKCSGKICEVPIIPKENKMLLEKMSILEREIQCAREDLRKSKKEKQICISDVDQSDPDTLRAIPHQTCLASRKISSKPKSSRVSYKIKEEEFQIPTKDRCGL